MSDDDQEKWLEALAGRVVDESDPEARQGREVREFFLRRIAEDNAGAPDPQQTLRIMNTLRARGAFAPPAGKPGPFGWLRARLSQRGLTPMRMGLGFGIAALALSLLLVPMVLQTGAHPDQALPGLGFRGGIQRVPMTSPTPEALARELGRQLDAEMIPNRIHEIQGHWVLEAKVPPERQAAVTARLKPWSVGVPASGALVIDVTPP